MKLPVFVLCLLSQLFCFAFARGEARRPEARVEQPALPDATVAAREAVAQAVLDGDLDPWLPRLHALALGAGPGRGERA